MIKARRICVNACARLGIGKHIVAGREKQGLTREAAAKKLGISPDYLGFLERSRPDPVSEKLAEKLMRKLGLSRKAFLRHLEAHNRHSRAYYKAYREHVKKAG